MFYKDFLREGELCLLQGRKFLGNQFLVFYMNKAHVSMLRIKSQTQVSFQAHDRLNVDSKALCEVLTSSMIKLLLHMKLIHMKTLIRLQIHISKYGLPQPR